MNPVALCNLALGKLGDAGGVVSIDPPDDSVQAGHCAQFYPIALAFALSQHNWSFATRTVTPSALVNDNGAWAYAFALPAGFAKLVNISTSEIEEVTEYSLELSDSGQSVLYVDEESITLEFVTSNLSSDNFPGYFIGYFTTLLASYLAGPILRGDVGVSAAKSLTQTALGELAIATVHDSRNVRRRRNKIPKYTQARR
ncbi:hypothetical protein [Methylomonas koyamae]|uniref:hypothetical protein n=1 Tax=Methylomonas koyamae TaxID=702114 RepID=UPI001127C87A|nr:hypothetical protein [Methylomonas koyamae]TPQ24936.1 hypothetical protein C2U68_17310 [Methylomonas koyamae]